MDKIDIAFLPTPIQEMPELRKALGPDCPKLFVKRDDLTGLATGGNKVRKLEYLISDAKAKGTTVLLTAGAAQSNHCRQTAAAAVLSGMRCVLVLGGTEQPKSDWKGNLLLDGLFNAEIIWTTRDKRNQVMAEVKSKLESEGEKPYLMPLGGSSPVGVFGYINAFTEAHNQITEQSLNISHMVVSTSTGGTQAGLILGNLRHKTNYVIEGMNNEPDDDMQSIISELINQSSKILSEQIQTKPADIVIPEWIGTHDYAEITENEVEAIKLFASTEALILDPVYTGRAASEMIKGIHSGHYKKTDSILFWHTGGVASVLHRGADIFGLI